MIKIFQNLKFLLFIYLVLIFSIAYYKSNLLSAFFDEISMLAANINFFRTGAPFVEHFYMEKFSPSISSGPISSIGSIISYYFLNNLQQIRFGNFIYIILLLSIFNFYISKLYKIDLIKLMILTGFILTIVPWWFGVLYSLGEMASMIFFVYSIIIYNKNSNLAMFLISISIFFGKFFIIAIFVPLYFLIIFFEDRFRLQNILFFTLPILFLSIFIELNSELNIKDYLLNIINLLQTHPSSGVGENVFWLTISSESELSTWSITSYVRLLITPIFSVFVITKYKNEIRENFNLNYILVITSILVPYFWFWIFNVGKWMRYTQFFTIPMLLFLSIFFIKFGQFEKRFTLYFAFLLFPFLNSIISLAFAVILLIFLLLHNSKESINLYFILVYLILTINSTATIYENYYEEKILIYFDSCLKSIDSYECFKEYS